MLTDASLPVKHTHLHSIPDRGARHFPGQPRKINPSSSSEDPGDVKVCQGILRRPGKDSQALCTTVAPIIWTVPFTMHSNTTE